MSRQDDISKLFLENEQKLDERPPAMAWDRLETKLDERSGIQKKTLYRQLLAIAAVFLIFSTVVFYTLNMEQENKAMATFAEEEDRSIYFAEEEGAKPPRPLLMSHKEKKFYRNQDLIAENQRPRSENRKREQIALNDIENEKIEEKTKQKEQIVTEMAASGSTTEPLPTNEEVAEVAEPIIIEEEVVEEAEPMIADVLEEKTIAEPSPIVETTTAAPAKPEAISIPNYSMMERAKEFNAFPSANEYEPAIEVEKIAKKDLPKKKALNKKSSDKSYPSDSWSRDELAREAAEAKAEKASKGWMKEAERAKMAAEKAAAKRAADEMARKKAERTPVIAADSKFKDAENDDMTAFQSIELFDWMEGEWKDMSGRSVESWTRYNSTTLSGKGYLLNKGKPVFSEDMLIKQINGNLFFIATLEQGKDPVYLKLRSYEGNRAVFVNESSLYPKEIIIQKISDDSFEISINADSINAIQNNFLSNRNAVLNNNATRNLKRTQE